VGSPQQDRNIQVRPIWMGKPDVMYHVDTTAMRDARKRSGHSQVSVARHMHMSQTQYSFIEQGHYLVNQYFLEQMVVIGVGNVVSWRDFVDWNQEQQSA
jgi:hypothetical protein